MFKNFLFWAFFMVALYGLSIGVRVNNDPQVKQSWSLMEERYYRDNCLTIFCIPEEHKKLQMRVAMDIIKNDIKAVLAASEAHAEENPTIFIMEPITITGYDMDEEVAKMNAKVQFEQDYGVRIVDMVKFQAYLDKLTNDID